MAKNLNDYSEEVKDKFLNRPIKPNTRKAIEDAYNATYKPTPDTNDVKMMGKGVNPDAVRNADPLVKKLMTKVLKLEEERDNTNKEVY